MRDIQREREAETQAETQAEGETGSMQAARRGTQSQVPRITPWAEGSTKPLSHPGCPEKENLKQAPRSGRRAHNPEIMT